MPLTSQPLAASLANDWMVTGDNYPGAVAESADRFAAAVSQWFAGAMASGFPCSTAMAKRAALAAALAPALSSQDAMVAGQGVALGLTTYMAAQLFGAFGVSAPPAGSAVAVTAIAGVFSDLEASIDARADRIATAITTLANTTLVTFTPPSAPPYVAPVT